MALALHSAPFLVRRAGICRASVQWGCATEGDALRTGLAFQEWLLQQNLPVQKVELKNVGAGGRGLVANKTLYKGDKLLYVPMKYAITEDTEWTCPEARAALKEKGVVDCPLIACQLISEASLGDKSPWHSYIAALPRYPECVLQWTIPDVQTHLSPTSIGERAIECLVEIEKTFENLKTEVFSQHPDIFSPEVYNLENFKWAFAIMLTRMAKLPSFDRKEALIPWADMINHSTAVDRTFLDYDSSTNSIVCRVDTQFNANEELFITYGKKSNAELVLSYGFIPTTNPNDSVKLKLALDPKDEMYEAKLEALRKYKLPSPHLYPLTVKGWPSQLVAYAALVASAPSEVDRYMKLAAAAVDKETKRMPNLSREEEIAAYTLILSLCEEAVARCDGYLLDTKIPKTSSLAKFATQLCESELKILFRAQYLLRNELRDLRSPKGRRKEGVFDKVAGFFRRTLNVDDI